MTPPPHAPTFAAFETALREHFDTYAANNIITLATTCWLNAGHL